VGIDRDLSSPLPWRRSLRASLARRSARARRRRLALRGRAGVALALVVAASAAAGALAQEPAPPNDGGGAGAASGGVPVAAVQRALGLPADGVYGRRTRAAVRRFQRRNGLTVDGVVGPQTLAALGLSAQPTTATGTSTPAALAQIAQCESGGDPTAVSADGRYFGKYQFSIATWRAVGGSGNPAAASEAEQDQRAAVLYRQQGGTPWPNCA
jgi:peptidoglycan hydrolase-like protein with peptidoglycan-binding domain